MPSLLPATSKPAHALPYPGLSFITFGDPDQARLPRQRKAVRSHAASYQYLLDKTSIAKHPSALGTRKQPRRRKRNVAVTLQLNIPDTAQPDPVDRCIVPQIPSPFGILGEGRVDPFRTYPVPWEPFLPELIDHCMYSF
jgi:hypothetical protein